jgi:hypothetical protein
MQEILQEAAKLKNAQLKVRTGRQTWEQSPDFFKQTHFADDEVLAARLRGSLKEKTELTMRLKDAGNQMFNEVMTGRSLVSMR